MTKTNLAPENLILSQRFEKYRKSKGLTYREIGAAFEKTEAAIRLASQRGAITEGFMRKLAKRFDINLNWALTGEGDMFNPEFSTQTYAAKEKTIDEIIDEKVRERINSLRSEIILLTARSIILNELKTR